MHSARGQGCRAGAQASCASNAGLLALAFPWTSFDRRRVRSVGCAHGWARNVEVRKAERLTMAKKKHAEGTLYSATAARRRRGGNGAIITLVALAVGVGAFVTWHRDKHPARRWARAVETAHALKIEAPLSRCFGGADGASIRRHVPEVRRGRLLPPFRDCQGGTLTEIVVAPMTFVPSLANPPSTAESAKVRERDLLERLRASLQNLQRAAQGAPRDRPLPDDQRDRIASALEDVAVDVDAERTGLNDLIRAADEAASLF